MGNWQEECGRKITYNDPVRDDIRLSYPFKFQQETNFGPRPYIAQAYPGIIIKESPVSPKCDAVRFDDCWIVILWSSQMILCLLHGDLLTLPQFRIPELVLLLRNQILDLGGMFGGRIRLFPPRW